MASSSTDYNFPPDKSVFRQRANCLAMPTANLASIVYDVFKLCLWLYHFCLQLSLILRFIALGFAQCSAEFSKSRGSRMARTYLMYKLVESWEIDIRKPVDAHTSVVWEALESRDHMMKTLWVGHFTRSTRTPAPTTRSPSHWYSFLHSQLHLYRLSLTHSLHIDNLHQRTNEYSDSHGRNTTPRWACARPDQTGRGISWPQWVPAFRTSNIPRC